MVNRIIEEYYKEVPAVLCTAGSYIRAANCAALRCISFENGGAELYGAMKADDVLKFEADLDSDMTGTSLGFELCDFFGYTRAKAFFDTLMGRRFAIVFLFDDEDIGISENEVAEKGAFALEKKRFSDFIKLLAVEEETVPDPAEGLVDIRRECHRIADMLCRDRDLCRCDIRIVESEELCPMETIPVDICKRSFMKMMLLCITALNGISKGKIIEIKLCRCEKGLLVALYTQGELYCEDNGKKDSAEKLLVSICQYISTRSACDVRISNKRGECEITLCFGEETYCDVDFKSPCDDEIFFRSYDHTRKCILSLI